MAFNSFFFFISLNTRTKNFKMRVNMILKNLFVTKFCCCKKKDNSFFRISYKNFTFQATFVTEKGFETIKFFHGNLFFQILEKPYYPTRIIFLLTFALNTPRICIYLTLLKPILVFLLYAFKKYDGSGKKVKSLRVWTFGRSNLETHWMCTFLLPKVQIRKNCTTTNVAFKNIQQKNQL